MMSQQVVGERTRLDHHTLVNSRVGDMGVITRVECAEATIAVVQFATMPELRDPASIGLTQILVFGIAHNVFDKNASMDQSGRRLA